MAAHALPPPPSALAESDARALEVLRTQLALPAPYLTCARCHRARLPTRSAWQGAVVWKPCPCDDADGAP